MWISLIAFTHSTELIEIVWIQDTTLKVSTVTINGVCDVLLSELGHMRGVREEVRYVGRLSLESGWMDGWPGLDIGRTLEILAYI